MVGCAVWRRGGGHKIMREEEKSIWKSALDINHSVTVYVLSGFFVVVVAVPYLPIYKTSGGFSRSSSYFFFFFFVNRHIFFSRRRSIVVLAGAHTHTHTHESPKGGTVEIIAIMIIVLIIIILYDDNSMCDIFHTRDDTTRPRGEK